MQKHTLQSSAMLLDLTIHSFTGRKTDRGESQLLNDRNNAARNSSSVVKNLFVGDEDLKNIGRIAAQARVFVRDNTLPWNDRGVRLVPTKKFFDLTEGLGELEREFWDSVESFIDDLPNKIAEAQHSLGSLFDARDYPTEIELRQKFGFSYRFEPVPDANDFRVDVQNEAMEFLRNNLEAGNLARMEAAREDLTARVMEVADTLNRWCEELPAGSRRPRIHATTLDRMKGVVNALTELNLFDDSKIAQAQALLESTLRGVEVEDIRDSEEFRSAVLADVQEIVNKFKM